MFASLLSAGLVLPRLGGPAALAEAKTCITVEAAITPDENEDLRVELRVAQDAQVAQGQPLMRLRDAPDIAFVAPMAGRVARIDLHPGQRLSQVVLFHDAEGERHQFDTGRAHNSADALRLLLQAAGLWRAFRSRPFGRMPRATEIPAAIFVMAVDTKPGAAAPFAALVGREDDFSRGLAALARFCGPNLFLCEASGQTCSIPVPAAFARLRIASFHPQGLPGIQIHRHFPAKPTAPVWDVHAEDIADIGALLATGYLPPTRLVAITGNAIRETGLVRCQKGADLRGLSQYLVRPGPHEVLSGSVLCGKAAHWLAPRDRQITLLERKTNPTARHWFTAALDRAARHAPIIPTAALDQALGGAVPATALVRALAIGDTEAFTRLGGLSFVEEDLALADYTTAASPRLATQLRAMLDKIETEENTV